MINRPGSGFYHTNTYTLQKGIPLASQKTEVTNSIKKPTYMTQTNYQKNIQVNKESTIGAFSVSIATESKIISFLEIQNQFYSLLSLEMIKRHRGKRT